MAPQLRRNVPQKTKYYYFQPRLETPFEIYSIELEILKNIL